MTDMFPPMAFTEKDRMQYCLKRWSVVPKPKWLEVQYWGDGKRDDWVMPSPVYVRCQINVSYVCTYSTQLRKSGELFENASDVLYGRKQILDHPLFFCPQLIVTTWVIQRDKHKWLQ